jgi:hypothetical protein
LYRKKLTKEKGNNLHENAAEMLAIMGIPVPIDGNALSIYNKALFDLGLHNFQNMSEESTDRRNINNGLTNLANALPEWNKSFANFCIEFPEGTPCPTSGKSTWFKHQKAARRGIKDKAEFEASHMNDEWLERWNAKNAEQLTGNEWRNNYVKFKRVFMDRWKKEL